MILKIGPASVAVIAISPNPFFVIATSALISPKQLPQASTVKLSTAYCISNILPPKARVPTTLSETKLIHAMLITKHNRDEIVMSHSGGFVFFVQNPIYKPRNNPGIAAKAPT